MNKWNPFRLTQYLAFHGIAWIGGKILDIHKIYKEQKKQQRQQQQELILSQQYQL